MHSNEEGPVEAAPSDIMQPSLTQAVLIVLKNPTIMLSLRYQGLTLRDCHLLTGFLFVFWL